VRWRQEQRGVATRRDRGHHAATPATAISATATTERRGEIAARESADRAGLSGATGALRQEGVSSALLEEVYQQDGAPHVERGRPGPQGRGGGGRSRRRVDPSSTRRRPRLVRG